MYKFDTLRTSYPTNCMNVRFSFSCSNAERVVRERFGKAVVRGVSDLGMKRATHSPISSLLDNAVIEVMQGW